MTTIAHLDKSVQTRVDEGHGTITIRVVVFGKRETTPTHDSAIDTPIDADADEMLVETDKRPISGYLEEPKRGRHVCVFLINGQRQHVWDNQFIMRDLDLKYLRNHMLVIIDCDGLKAEAVAELMQGSRQNFYQGQVYAALEARVIATLKGDPDLRRLEEDAEDDVSNLQAGDEAVKTALDQLIELHHEAAIHASHGHAEGGEASRQDGMMGALPQSQDVVVDDDQSTGASGSDPTLQLHPDVATIRLKPNEERRLTVAARPDQAWKSLEIMAVTFDPPVEELQVTRSEGVLHENMSLKFTERGEVEDDTYPIVTTLRCLAMFTGHSEARMLERRIVITPPKQHPTHPAKPLNDVPSFIRVTSRPPIRIVIGGPDVHVKLRWDGKDELVSSPTPSWSFRVACDAPTIEPETFLTQPSDGRFELLIKAAPGLEAGQQLKFDVEATGPGTTLATTFTAEVVEPPAGRKVPTKLAGGGQRRPPYDLRYLERASWSDGNLNCFGEPWSAADPGSFERPSATSPLVIFINKDTDLLTTYREKLLAKKLAEATVQQRVTRYTAHVAFHLYQMYEEQRLVESRPERGEDSLSEDSMRNEIQRVAQTIIGLMDVVQ